MKNKEIIFLTESMIGAGGVVKVITMWANFFSKKRKERIIIVSLKKGKPFFKLNKNISFNIENFVSKYKILFLLKNIYTMFYFLKKHRNSSIIVNKSMYIEPIFFWRVLGFFQEINLVYFVHGGNSDFISFYRKRLLTRHRTRMIFKVFDKVICLYQDVPFEKMPVHIDLKKIQFLPNPILNSRRNECLEKENIILFLGRVTKEKGVDTLLKSWNLIQNRYKDWYVNIVGSGKDKEMFIEMAKILKLKRIEFFEETNETELFYNKSKVFVLPSLFEGWGLTIMEAKMYNNIVIASNTAGAKKLIRNHQTGYLFNIGDEVELSMRLEKVLQMYQNNSYIINKIRQESFKELQMYSIEEVYKKWENILL